MSENRCQNQGEHTICRTTRTNIVTRGEFNFCLSFLAVKIKRDNWLHVSYQERKNMLKRSKDFTRIVF